MRQEGYILVMLNNLSARGSLFVFVRTHHHLGYYFHLSDTRRAANQTRLPAKVVQIHPIAGPKLS